LDFGRAEPVDQPARHVVDRDERAGGRTTISHRLHDQRRLEPPEPAPAALLGDVDRGEPQLCGGLDCILGKDVLLVPLGGERRNPLRGKAPRRLLDGELVRAKLELARHPPGYCPLPMIASASISTFQRGSAKAEIATRVPVGRVALSARLNAALTVIASAMSVTNMRIRTTSPMCPPSCSICSRINWKQRSAWASALSLTEPSASTPTVPETAIVLPTRIARVKPISSSKGESAGMRWRPSCGSAMAFAPGAFRRSRHRHPSRLFGTSLPGLSVFSTAGDARDGHGVVVGYGHTAFAE